jgi:hypothetical protein
LGFGAAGGTAASEVTPMMATLELSAEESRLLREVLESFMSDLRMEIADTDLFDFREQLKEKKRVLSELLERL